MPDNNNVHEVWSERELDDAMTALYADVAVNRDAQARARAELLLAANAGEPPEHRTAMPQPAVKSRRAVPLVAAAAAVALVAVAAVLVSQNSSPEENDPAFAPQRPPATSGSQHAPMPAMPNKPQNRLDSLAPRVSEPPLAPGQFRYVSSAALRRVDIQGTSGTTYTFLAEYRSERWIPADQRQEWMMRNQATPNRQWIKGTEQEAHADGVPLDMKLIEPDGETRAPCGSFMPVDNSKPSCAPETAGPIPSSNDPAKLYKWLADGSATHADPPVQFFRMATELLDSRYPVAVRRAALEALSRHPYLTVVDTTTRDNRPAISAGIEYADGALLQEVLLDPANGQLIGRRETYLKAADGAKPGDKYIDEASHQAVVSSLGAQPPR